jgi:CsoR family transcriptional regulator, copper-sensing transcriptional repressor
MESKDYVAGKVPVDTSAKPEVMKRLNYIEGHLQGVKRMVEDEKYCVDVLKQTYAIRRAIEKLEAIILESHLQGCVVHGIREGREKEVIDELAELYNLAGR